MSRRDWLFVGGVLAVFVVVAVFFRAEPDDAPDAPKSTPEPVLTEDPAVKEAWEEFFNLPDEEHAWGFGWLEGEELGANRTQLTRQVIQDSIFKYDEELVVEPGDIQASCRAVLNFAGDLSIPEFASALTKSVPISQRC